MEVSLGESLPPPNLVSKVRNVSSLYIGWTWLLSTTFTFISSYNSFFHIPVCFPSNPFLLTPTALAAHPLGPSTARGLHPWAQPGETCLFSLPAWRPQLPGLLAEESAGPMGPGHNTRTSFPSVPPQGRGALFPPPLSPSCFPGQVHPGHLAARGQSATFQWLHTPHGEGSGILHGGWGCGREGKVQQRLIRLLCPLLWDQSHGAGRATGSPRTPSRSPSTSEFRRKKKAWLAGTVETVKSVREHSEL